MVDFTQNAGSTFGPNGVGRIGFLGTGRLTKMLVLRLIEMGYQPDRISVTKRNQDIANELHRNAKVRVESDPQKIADCVDCLLICLPLHCAKKALEPLKLRPDQVVISMVGGLSLKELEPICGPADVHCAMLPGLPSQNGSGLTIVYPGSPDVDNFLNQFGAVCASETSDMFIRLSTYGGLSGCLFHQIWQMEGALGEIGVDPKQARILLGNAFLGVGKTVLAHDKTTLKDLTEQVVTPGGVTEQGIEKLEKSQLITTWTAATLDMLKALGGEPPFIQTNVSRNLQGV